jgi:hypothetical protein
MTINMSTIAQIQKAGQAVHYASLSLERDAQALNAALQKALQQAMTSASDDARTEEIFTAWKKLSKIAHDVAQMESALRDVYTACTTIPSAKAAKKAATTAKRGKLGRQTAVTDGKSASRAKKANSRQVVVNEPGVPREGNEQKLMEYFGTILSTTEQKPVHHIAIVKATGIPAGSVAATIKRLARKSLLETGHRGALRLLAAPSTAAPTTTP